MSDGCDFGASAAIGRRLQSKARHYNFAMRNSPTRLAELRRLLVLDSMPERDFDNITRLLAATLNVPIAIINLLDEQRDWFKSRVGLSQTESPAATSICEVFFHAAEDLIVVEDTLLDPRFRAHPLVVGGPCIRFYASARLALGSHTMGTLCAYDLKPQQPSEHQVLQLQSLATAVVALLQKRAEAAAAPAPAL